MKKIFFAYALLFGITFSTSFLLAQEKMWVTSTNAKLRAEKTVSSEIVTKLPFGTELAVIKRNSKWIYVRTQSMKEGWVYKGRLSETPPQKESQDETKNLLSGAFGSSIGVNEAGTDRSIRGLSKETEQYAKNRGTPISCQKALDEMLSLTVTEKELEAFLKKGHIGEFAL